MAAVMEHVARGAKRFFTMSFTIDKETHARLRKTAYREERPVSDLIRELLSDGLDRRERRKRHGASQDSGDASVA